MLDDGGALRRTLVQAVCRSILSWMYLGVLRRDRACACADMGKGYRRWQTPLRLIVGGAAPENDHDSVPGDKVVWAPVKCTELHAWGQGEGAQIRCSSGKSGRRPHC